MLQKVVHLLGLFNLISQVQYMEKNGKVELVNYYCVNVYNRHGKSMATTPQVDELFVLDCVLDQAQESTEYTDIDDSCLLALKMTGYASRHDAEKRMLWHCCFPRVGLQAVEILPPITDALRMTGRCNCKSCLKCKLVRKPFTPITSCATEPLQLVHWDICGPLETAIRGGRHMLLCIDDARRHMEEWIL